MRGTGLWESTGGAEEPHPLPPIHEFFVHQASSIEYKSFQDILLLSWSCPDFQSRYGLLVLSHFIFKFYQGISKFVNLSTKQLGFSWFFCFMFVLYYVLSSIFLVFKMLFFFELSELATWLIDFLALLLFHDIYLSLHTFSKQDFGYITRVMTCEFSLPDISKYFLIPTVDFFQKYH